jgi:hypothetical protein
MSTFNSRHERYSCVKRVHSLRVACCFVSLSVRSKVFEYIQVSRHSTQFRRVVS